MSARLAKLARIQYSRQEQGQVPEPIVAVLVAAAAAAVQLQPLLLGLLVEEVSRKEPQHW
jgi:hypothetical protein